MIIIKTKNGDRFVNDKQMLCSEHNKEKQVFDAYFHDGLVRPYRDVELVRYVSDAQAVDITDKGSENQELSEANKIVRSKLANMYKVIDTIKDDMRQAFSRIEANAQDKDVPVEIRKRIMEYCTDIRCKVNSYYYQDMLDKLNKQKEL